MNPFGARRALYVGKQDADVKGAKSRRTLGLSAVALQGAVDLISAAGGGVVEGYPHDTQGKKKSVLYNGTRTLFERAGFTFVRSKGTGNCVMRRSVP